MSPPVPVAARRFLHCCYCTSDVEGAIPLLCKGLGLEVRMRGSREPVDGTQMGFPGDVATDTRFVYDSRGPRVAPAIEVQEWIDPPTVGRPYGSPTHVGLHALGLAVADVEGTIDSVARLGASLVGRTGPASAAPIMPRTTLVRDPTGVVLDIVEAPDLEAGAHMAHVRATCTDLDRSLEWYGALGFELAGETRRARLAGEAFGMRGDVELSEARLRLPDEPFALLLLQWHDPPSHGAPYASGNHAGLYRFAVAVDDTRAAHAELTRGGWTTADPPRVVPLAGTNVADMWIAFLTDPDGITIELVERPRSAFRTSR